MSKQQLRWESVDWERREKNRQAGEGWKGRKEEREESEEEEEDD